MIHQRNDDTVVGDLVEAVWMDAAFGLDEPIEPLELRTVGWITQTTEHFVTIAQERDADDFFRAYTSIPRACLCEVVRLEQVRE